MGCRLTQLVLEEVPCENPIGFYRRRPGERDRALLDISAPENGYLVWHCRRGKTKYYLGQVSLCMDYTLNPYIILVFYVCPTSFRGSEGDRVAAGSVSSPIEHHDNQAVFREGPQSRDHGVVPVPRKCQGVLLPVAFLRGQQTTKPPPVDLPQRSPTKKVHMRQMVPRPKVCTTRVNFISAGNHFF